MIQAFPAAPGLREINQFLAANQSLLAWLRRPARNLRVATSHLPAAMLPAVAAFRGWDLPEITSFGALADWLGVTAEELGWLSDPYSWERRRTSTASRNYWYRWLHRPGKSPRLIESPKPHLRGLQHRILHQILDHVPPHPAAHGFRQGRSTKTFVEPHVNRDVVCRIDLRNFFAQIRRPRVTALFRTLGYPESVAQALAALSTNAVPDDVFESALSAMSLEAISEIRRTFSTPHLPQGAPTSPGLANLIAYRLDCRLAGLARAAGGNYTRYADDLVFSGSHNLARSWPRLKTLLLAIVLDEGFSIRERKTKVMLHAGRQQVAGLVINEAVHLPREEFDILKACLFNCCRFGPASQNREGHHDFRAHLLGRIGYVRQFQPQHAEKLLRLWEQINWTA